MPYNIKIRTKEGTYEYEKEDLTDLDLILIKHPTYNEIRAEQKKVKTLTKEMKRNVSSQKK